MEALPEFLPLLVRHDGEVDADGLHAVQLRDGVAHGLLDLGLQRAPGHGQGYLHLDTWFVDANLPDHAEVHDAAAEFRVLYRLEGLDNLDFGDRHGFSSAAVGAAPPSDLVGIHQRPGDRQKLAVDPAGWPRCRIR